jgi:serine/threonine-protein kinase
MRAQVPNRGQRMHPGTLIGQNVRLIRVLGEGGMGSVWLAEHLTLRTHVAVKFMSEVLAKDPEARARFSAEAAAAASVKSPHIVQMFDHGVSAGRPYIVMEHLSGETLAARLERVTRLSPEETAEVVRQTCKGLAKAHAAGIVHRDIKPENLFLTAEDGELCVKVLDFGIARVGGEDASRTQTGSMIGTPLYMSPEQVKSVRGVDARSDLWSLAVVVYRTLTGHMPFDGETAGAIFIAIDSAPVVPPSAHVPALGVSMDAWQRRALERDREARFGSARELSDAFMAAVASPHELLRGGSLSPVAKDTSSSFASLPLKRSAGLPARRSFLRAAVIGIMATLGIVIVIASVRAATGTTATAIPPPIAPPTQTPTPTTGPWGSTPPLASTATPTPTPTSTPTPTPTPTPTSTPVVPVVSPSSLPAASSAPVTPVRKKKDRGF